MSTLPTFKTLQASDFPDQYADLINQLALIFNNEIQSVFNALNNGVSLNDNIFCVVKTIPVTVDVNGNTTNTANFQISIPNMRVQGCTVIRAVNTSNSSIFPTGAPFVSFTPGTQQVTINNVTGLTPGQQWSITLIAWGM
jgi:hypothetical protein